MKKNPSKFRRNQSELARELGISRSTIQRYLGMPGAPARGPHHRYDRRAVAKWIIEHGSANVEGSEIRELTLLKMRQGLELLQIEMAFARGETLLKKNVAPIVASAMAEFTANLIQKFERELPSKYKGRSATECQQMNETAIAFVMRRLKEGLQPLLGGD